MNQAQTFAKTLSQLELIPSDFLNELDALQEREGEELNPSMIADYVIDKNMTSNAAISNALSAKFGLPEVSLDDFW